MAAQQHRHPLARLVWRFAAMLAFICCATLLASAYLIEGSLRNAQQEAFSARFTLATQRAATAAENALALGVPIAPDTPLAQLLTREAALEPVLYGFTVETAQGKTLLQAAGRHPAPATDDAVALAQTAIRNDLGQTVGWARLRYDESALHTARQHLSQAVWTSAWLASALLCLGLAGCCAWLLRHTQGGRKRSRLPLGERTALLLAAIALLTAVLLALGWRAATAGQASIAPDQMAKATAVARSSAALVARALAAGVPLDQLAGVDAHAAALHARSPEITALAVVTADGHTMAGTPLQPGPWTVQAPVTLPGADQPSAQVLLQVDSGLLARRLQGTLLDMAFLGVVSLLLALEWVALGLGTRGARALSIWQARRSADPAERRAWRAGSAAAVRPALFLFMLAEEFTRPFLPTWGRSLAPEGALFTPDTLAGLPLAAFLAVVALLQWPLAAWSERFGRRRGLALGALLGAAGLAWAALQPQFAALLGARIVSAVGFAMVFVSAQGAVIDGSSAGDRAHSLAQFVRAILVAGLCGPPLGGLAAERWGVPATFALAAAVSLLAAAVAWLQVPPGRPAPASAPQAAARRAPLAAVLRQPGLAALLLGCAMPAKLLLAALCFYLLPLHLQDQGEGSAVIGRLQTVYPLTMVLLVPVAARLADRWRQRRGFVLAGGLLAGAGAVLAWPTAGSAWYLALVLLVLGLGQALSITPQSAMVADLARSLPERQGAAVLGLFRLTERSGSALGPVMAAWLLPLLGFGPAVALIGALVLGGSAAYGWSQRSARACAVNP